MKKQCDSLYLSETWKELRIIIRKQLTEDSTCPFCSVFFNRVRPINIHVDHIKPVKFYWHRRFDLSNLQALCSSCNKLKGSLIITKEDIDKQFYQRSSMKEHGLTIDCYKNDYRIKKFKEKTRHGYVWQDSKKTLKELEKLESRDSYLSKLKKQATINREKNEYAQMLVEFEYKKKIQEEKYRRNQQSKDESNKVGH